MSEIVNRSGLYKPDAAGDEVLERYGRGLETEVLLDRELNIRGHEVGRDVLAAAAADLRDRGIDPETCSQEQLFAAMRRHS